MYKQEHLWNTPFARRSYQQKNAAIAVTNQISMYTNKAALRFPVKQIFLSCPEHKIEAKSPTFCKNPPAKVRLRKQREPQYTDGGSLGFPYVTFLIKPYVFIDRH